MTLLSDAPSRAGRTTRMRVLCADDDPAIRLLLALNLHAEGLEVEILGDGVDVCDRARATQPDLVVLDVMMPGRDGYEVLRQLKSETATRDIPVVLLTARATDEEVWEGWQSGADYYVTKPFDVSQLMYFVWNVLGGHDTDDAGRAGP